MRAGNSKAIEIGLDEGLKSLLDHVAVELAEEYVRLMERAAEEARAPSPTPTTAADEGDSP